MLEQTMRHHYQRWLVDPMAVFLQTKIGPGYITLTALISGMLIVPALLYHYKWIAIILLLLSGYLDTLDGTVARYTSSSSALGTIYDIMADRIVEFSVIFGLWLVDTNQRGLVCFMMLGSILFCVTSFLVVGIFTPNDSQKGFHYSPGLIERAEAFIIFSFMILFPSIFIFLAISFILLVNFTTMVRLYEFKKYHAI